MVVVKFNNSKGSRFSDMPVVVTGADLFCVTLQFGSVLFA